MKKAILIISLVVVLVCGVFIFYKYQKITNIYDSMYFNFLKFGEIESEKISVEEREYLLSPSNGDVWSDMPGEGDTFDIDLTDGKDVRIGGSKVEDITVQRDTKSSNMGAQKGTLSITIFLDSDYLSYFRIFYNAYKDIGPNFGKEEPEKSEAIEVVNEYVIVPFLEVQSSRFTTTNWGIEVKYKE